MPARDMPDRRCPTLGQRMAILGMEGTGELQEDGLIARPDRAASSIPAMPDPLRLPARMSPARPDVKRAAIYGQAGGDRGWPA